MTQPIAYLNGQWLPQADMGISVDDTGFVQGVTVAERMRTFGGRLFRVAKHLDRLADCLAIVGVESPLPRDALARLCDQIVARNHRLLDGSDDLGLCLFVTPGPYGAHRIAATSQPVASPPTLGLHTSPLPFSSIARAYEEGETLFTSTVRQIAPDQWPLQLKCRSRMHYYLADREAHLRQPGSRALLLTQDGRVSEASTANFLIHTAQEGIVSPTRDVILPGVSLEMIEELAVRCDLPMTFRDLTPVDLSQADEMLLCSTSPCLLPVTQWDGQPVGSGKPGPVFEQLITAWSESVQCDIRAQARKFAVR